MKFVPGLTIIPYSLNRVELRKGIWNSESTIMEDVASTGVLWPTLDFMSQGLDSEEILQRVSGLTRDVYNDLVTRLLSMRVLIEEQSNSQPHRITSRPVWIFSDSPHLARLLNQILLDEGVEVTILGENTKPAAVLFRELRLDTSTDELLQEENARQIALGLEQSPDAFLVVAMIQNNPALLRSIDKLARRAGISWLHAAIDGPALYIGPFVIPGVTASYQTFEQRVAMNLRERQSYLSWMRAAISGKVRFGEPVIDSSVLALLAAHVAHEVTNLAFQELSTTRNKVLSIYLPTMEISYNDILPLAKYDTESQFNVASDLYYDIREWLNEDKV